MWCQDCVNRYSVERDVCLGFAGEQQKQRSYSANNTSRCLNYTEKSYEIWYEWYEYQIFSYSFLPLRFLTASDKIQTYCWIDTDEKHVTDCLLTQYLWIINTQHMPWFRIQKRHTYTSFQYAPHPRVTYICGLANKGTQENWETTSETRLAPSYII